MADETIHERALNDETSKVPASEGVPPIEKEGAAVKAATNAETPAAAAPTVPAVPAPTGSAPAVPASSAPANNVPASSALVSSVLVAPASAAPKGGEAPASANLGTKILSGGASQDDAEDAGAQSSKPLRNLQQVILKIQGTPMRVLLVDNMTLMLGRSDPNMNIRPDIDLTLYGGGERGVSRVHARLQFRDNKLWITDLASSNGTYLLDKRLDAHKPAEIKPGDIVALGKLIITLELAKD